MKKKVIIIASIVIGVIAIVGINVYTDGLISEILGLREVSYVRSNPEKIADKKIDKIVIYGGTGYYSYIEIDDDKLIKKWTDYLRAAGVIESNRVYEERNGLSPRIKMYSGNKVYLLAFPNGTKENLISSGSYYYVISNGEDNPYDEIYDEASKIYEVIDKTKSV